MTYKDNDYLPRMTAKELGFRVGDKFILGRGLPDASCEGLPTGTVLSLTKDDGSLCPYFVAVENTGKRRCFYFDQLIPIAEYNDTKGNTMTVSTEDIKNLALSDDDRLLVEEGLLTREGPLTDTGKLLLETILLNEHKTVLVTQAKALRKARKDAK